MQDFDRLIIRFRQFGGIRLLWQYLLMGVLWTGIKECIRCLVNRRSFKNVYPLITRKIDGILTEKYANAPLYTVPNTSPNANVGEDVIWFCWLQGMDNAPELVRACHNSILTNLPHNKVVIITADNYQKYVTLPEYIERKYHNGIIPHPLFSDILRLALLIRYGGTWIDASVLCTSDKYWEVIQKCRLFLFRYFHNGKEEGVSNWFIHAAPGNILLSKILGMILTYWQDYNCTLEYYIFHLFYSIAARQYPEEVRHMPRGNSYANIRLGRCLHKDFSSTTWQHFTSEVSFHKLNYRNNEKADKNLNSLYHYIIRLYS